MGHVAWKPLFVVLVPSLLIMSAAGVVAVPAYRELGELQARETEIDRTLAEAARVRPLLLEYESKGAVNARILQEILDESLPPRAEVRLLMEDIYRAQQASGVHIQVLRQVTTSSSSEDGASVPRGSLWSMRTEGSYEQLTVMLEEIQSLERLYVAESLDLGVGKNGTIRATLRLLVPWLDGGSGGGSIAGPEIR